MALINQTLNGYTFTEFIGAGGLVQYIRLQRWHLYALSFPRRLHTSEYKQSGQNNRIQREIDIIKPLIILLDKICG